LAKQREITYCTGFRADDRAGLARKYRFPDRTILDPAVRIDGLIVRFSLYNQRKKGGVMRRGILPVLLVCLLPGALSAIGGRIPIHEGGVISTSGSYVVTQDFTGDIVIDADSVTIDLDGHTVNGTVSAVDHTGLILTNGSMEGSAATGISFTSSVGGEYAITHLSVNGFDNGISVIGSSVVPVRANISSVQLGGSPSSTLAGIRLQFVMGSIIEGSQIRAFERGIDLMMTGDSMILGNAVARNNRVGINVDSSHGNTLSRNHVTENCETGIQLLNSENNMIASNTVGRNGNTALGCTASFPGIMISGAGSIRNTIESNQISGNGSMGMVFDSNTGTAATCNSYLGNSARGNAGGGFGLNLGCAPDPGGDACPTVQTGQTSDCNFNDGNNTPLPSACPNFTFMPQAATLPVCSLSTIPPDCTLTIEASGGMGPYNYLLSLGWLPSGLSFVSSPSGGVISGAPTQVGTWSFTVQAQDQSGCNGFMTYSLTIVP
jgi:parallel beta-helix repeat protein